jgi:hypothetical protein
MLSANPSPKTGRRDKDMDLLDFKTGSVEARFASVEELRAAADRIDSKEIRMRLRAVATLRDYLEERDREIIEGLLGRLGPGPLDDVTIVLEMTGQQVVEEELREGKLCPPPGD